MSLLREILDELSQRLLAGESLLFLQTVDESRWLQALSQRLEENGAEVGVWSLSQGLIANPAASFRSQANLKDPSDMLDQLPSLPGNAVVIAKDLQYYLNDPPVLRRMLDRAQSGQGPAVLAMGSEFELSPQLTKTTTLLQLPPPDFEEIATCLNTVLAQQEPPLEITADFHERMIKSVIGLSLDQARRAFARVISGRSDLGEEAMTQLVSEKKQLLQGSNFLEFFDLDETADDIGGLNGLKSWVAGRAKAFSPEARRQHVGQPKGVLLLGVQGCGKSLSSRVIARQLSFPLIRFDFANLLQAGRGSSEQNLREVLRMMDSIAPAVLWIEELDKGFAGLSAAEENKDAAIARMFGLFLTWMQEHRSPIFVVATANAIENLPPELLRRGRFDELFFIDLPNFHERQHIFQIHLSKRDYPPAEFELETLADKTEGYSGAEIEQIVNSAVIDAFTQGRQATMKDLLDAIEAIVPLSVTMEDQVFQLREWARSRCRPATPDSRVFRMLEEEHRKGQLTAEDEEFPDPWIAPLEAGDLSGAVLEFVRASDFAHFCKIQDALGTRIATLGNSSIVLESDRNVVVWQGLSQDLAEAIAKYINSKRIFMNPVQVSQYQKLGKVLKIPVLQELRDKKLPRDVWFPVALRIMPPREGSGRLREVVVLHE
ncbi:MAG: AAA family ATPase [Planctomycetaceae bacterium]|nr:AAA family ATPase [Planctomycetaceae bacterium]